MWSRGRVDDDTAEGDELVEEAVEEDAVKEDAVEEDVEEASLPVTPLQHAIAARATSSACTKLSRGSLGASATALEDDAGREDE